jgi:hypothetical protein
MLIKNPHCLRVLVDRSDESYALLDVSSVQSKEGQGSSALGTKESTKYDALPAMNWATRQQPFMCSSFASVASTYPLATPQIWGSEHTSAMLPVIRPPIRLQRSVPSNALIRR